MGHFLDESRHSLTPDQEYRFSCRRRIRGTMYVWGSREITNDLHFETPPILYLRNDVYGEPITIRTERADGTSNIIGTLDAGAYFSIPIQDIRAVSVTCDLESTVTCALSGDPGERRFVDARPSHVVSGPRSSAY